MMHKETAKSEESLPRYRLIELRRKTGTQRKVASDLNISETYLRQLEKGLANPGVSLMFKIAHYLKTDVYDCWKDLSGERPFTVNLMHK
ncbi:MULTISPECIES: helix-turn-helix domain-containing protein [Paenibacillus]|uniref:helix-turn-helix domain-containing protein n=1 Tax=Paenibacillus TaxID=44249 RepID=UPI000472D72F|nr:MULTISPECIES: helix-turn-helix transcriptional regulator [Paenibacillus]MBY7736323.1 helix-turn-helix domain-containing protein [Paenibacillus polymyxa]